MMRTTKTLPVRTPIQKIKVHVLNFWTICNSHLEIVLELPDNKLYLINAWDDPKGEAALNDKDCLDSLSEASESTTIEIEADIDDIIRRWQEKYNREHEDFGCCCNNCADAGAWFLEEFADISKPSSCRMPITINYLCCGFFAPSFLQCCTLPGRIFDLAKAKSIDSSASQHKISDENQHLVIEMPNIAL